MVRLCSCYLCRKGNGGMNQRPGSYPARSVAEEREAQKWADSSLQVPLKVLFSGRVMKLENEGVCREQIANGPCAPQPVSERKDT